MSDRSTDVKVSVQDAQGHPVHLYVQAVGGPEGAVGGLEGADGAGEQEISGGVPGLDGAFTAIQAVGDRLANAIKAVAPDKFTVELDFEFKAEAGGLTALLVRSGGSASVKVTMEWARRPAPSPTLAPPPTSDA